MGIQLFIDTNTYLKGSQFAGERSRALLKAWADNQRGVIICVDRSSRGLPFLHVSADLWHRYTNSKLFTVLRLAAEEMGRNKMSEEPIASGVRLLIKGTGRAGDLGAPAWQCFSKE